jgi:hypothetical protein
MNLRRFWAIHQIEFCRNVIFKRNFPIHKLFERCSELGLWRPNQKFLTFLRNEICSNNLSDSGLRKGLENLLAVRDKFLAMTGRFAAFQAHCLNVQESMQGRSGFRRLGV